MIKNIDDIDYEICSLCGTTFNSPFSLRIHFKNNHSSYFQEFLKINSLDKKSRGYMSCITVYNKSLLFNPDISQNFLKLQREQSKEQSELI